MQTLYTHEAANIRKTWFLFTVFLIIVIGLGYFLSIYFGHPGILYFAVFFAIFQSVLSYWFSHKIVLSMTGAKEASPEANRELWNIVENLSITAGLPMPKLYIINDSIPNAFATGRNKEHASVAVTTGLLQILEKTELEGVIAHELSHIGNRDILISTVAVVLAGFVSIVSDMFLRSHILGGNRDNDSKASGIFMIVGIVLAILAPIFAMLIQFAISRKREFLADASGALLTRYPEGLANALRKISQYVVPMHKASNATAHLFIANPFGNVRKIGKLFMTHPPVEERIRALIGK